MDDYARFVLDRARVGARGPAQDVEHDTAPVQSLIKKKKKKKRI